MIVRQDFNIFAADFEFYDLTFLLIREQISGNMETLKIFSIFIETIIAILSVLLWIRKGKASGAFIFVTFTIYVFYDIARMYSLAIPEPILRIAFAIAVISMLIAVWRLYNKE